LLQRIGKKKGPFERWTAWRDPDHLDKMIEARNDELPEADATQEKLGLMFRKLDHWQSAEKVKIY